MGSLGDQLSDADPRKNRYTNTEETVFPFERDVVAETTCGYDRVTEGMCSNFDQNNCACMAFQYSVPFDSPWIWIVYALAIASALLLSTVYSSLICCKYPHLKHVLKWHVGIFLINITTWFWLPFIIFNAICKVHYGCGVLHYILASPLVLICIILSLIDMGFSPEAKYFRNQKKSEETSQFLDRLRAAKPAVAVKIECFHYEVRTNRNSNVQDNARFKTVEKVTFRERRLFPIDGFLDVSQVPHRLEKRGVTLFEISKSVTPGDRYSQDCFHHFKNRYIAANNHRDQAMHTSIEVHIPDLTEDRVMTVDGSPPLWANKWCFYVCSLLHIGIIPRYHLSFSFHSVTSYTFQNSFHFETYPLLHSDRKEIFC